MKKPGSKAESGVSVCVDYAVLMRGSIALTVVGVNGPEEVARVCRGAAIR